jgi:hypothetical protein
MNPEVMARRGKVAAPKALPFIQVRSTTKTTPTRNDPAMAAGSKRKAERVGIGLEESTLVGTG